MAKGMKMYRARGASGQTFSISKEMARKDLFCDGCGPHRLFVRQES